MHGSTSSIYPAYLEQQKTESAVVLETHDVKEEVPFAVEHVSMERRYSGQNPRLDLFSARGMP
jgi:hypothetical protein